MNKKRILLLIGVLSAGAITLGCNTDDSYKREVLSVEQKEAALAELENIRKERREKIATLDNAALVEALEGEEYVAHQNIYRTIKFDEKPAQYFYVEPLKASYIGPLGRPYTADRFKRLKDYNSPEELLDIYRNNFVASTSSRQGQWFQFREPFAFPFKSQLQFTQVVMDKGETKALPDLLDWVARTDEIRYDPERFYFLEERTENDQQPVKLLGEVETELPKEVLQFEFKASDVGKTVKQNGYSVTLVGAGDFNYDLKIEVPDDAAMPLRDEDIVGEALSPTERELQLRMDTTLQPDYHEKMGKWLDEIIERAMRGEVDAETVRTEGNNLHAKLSVGEGRVLHKAFSFMGPVGTARVTLLPRKKTSEKVTHKIELPIHFFGPQEDTDEIDLSALPDIDLAGPVYDERVKRRVDLTSEEMKQLIDIRYEKVHHRPKFAHTERIYLKYPPVQSQLFLSSSERFQFNSEPELQRKILTQMVKFLDSEDDVIELTRDKNEVFSFTQYGFAYTPEFMSESPARIEAIIPVLTAPNIVKKSYSADNLPEGLRLDDNRLIVDYDRFTPEETLDSTRLKTQLRNRFFAKNAAQEYLQPFENVMIKQRKEGEPVHIFYFYGQPESIEIWYRGKTKLIDFEMDIKSREHKG